MKKNIFASLVILGAVAALSWSARADQGVRDDNTTVAPSSVVTVSPSYVIRDSGHVANGVALRNKASGTIHLRGVPPSSTVTMALLYWNLLDGSAVGAASQPALFKGILVIGAKVADNPDPCWSSAGSHTYRADVTGLVSRTLPNQDYEVVVAFDSTTETLGGDPWISSPGPRRIQGATLVVTYKNTLTSKGTSTVGQAVCIYDLLGGSGGSGSITANLVHPLSLSGGGLFTMAGADGQANASNETGFFNGTQFSGPPVAHSDWDGDTGTPLPQLFDVHTHTVTMGASPSVVSYAIGSDCVTPVVFVLQAKTP